MNQEQTMVALDRFRWVRPSGNKRARFDTVVSPGRERDLYIPVVETNWLRFPESVSRREYTPWRSHEILLKHLERVETELDLKDFLWTWGFLENRSLNSESIEASFVLIEHLQSLSIAGRAASESSEESELDSLVFLFLDGNVNFNLDVVHESSNGNDYLKFYVVPANLFSFIHHLIYLKYSNLLRGGKRILGHKPCPECGVIFDYYLDNLNSVRSKTCGSSTCRKRRERRNKR